MSDPLYSKTLRVSTALLFQVAGCWVVVRLLQQGTQQIHKNCENVEKDAFPHLSSETKPHTVKPTTGTKTRERNKFTKTAKTLKKMRSRICRLTPNLKLPPNHLLQNWNLRISMILSCPRNHVNKNNTITLRRGAIKDTQRSTPIIMQRS